MSWNHRVCKETTHGEVSYSIREVFYTDAGAVSLYSFDPDAPYGETLDELRADMARMTAAVEKPVLDLDTLEFDA
jgi:hypothetical protein